MRMTKLSMCVQDSIPENDMGGVEYSRNDDPGDSFIYILIKYYTYNIYVYFMHTYMYISVKAYTLPYKICKCKNIPHSRHLKCGMMSMFANVLYPAVG